MGEGKKERMLPTTKASQRSFPLHQGSKSGMSVFLIAAPPSSRCPGKAAPWTELVPETPGEEGRSPPKQPGTPIPCLAPPPALPEVAVAAQRCSRIPGISHGLINYPAIPRNGGSPNYSPGLVPLFGLVSLPEHRDKRSRSGQTMLQRRKEPGRERGSCVLQELGCSLQTDFSPSPGHGIWQKAPAEAAAPRFRFARVMKG